MKNNPAIGEPVIYTSHQSRYRAGNQFIDKHVFGYIMSGSLVINDGRKAYTFRTSDFFFLQRNQLAKFDQLPAVEGAFTSVSVFLDQQILRSIREEYNLALEKRLPLYGVLALQGTPLLKNFIDVLLPALQFPDQADPYLLNLKVKEAVFLLLVSKPELADVLFDFSAPAKTDLKDFMLHNYQFNVSLDRFAYLTGRSLDTFKRDFDYIFQVSPGRWIQHQRLKEAYYQIKERGRRSADVYQDVGFESITHFSYSFKRLFGVSPSSL